MAREESPREDILREATALTTRAEFSIDDFDQPIVVGFRSNGAASLYFGQDEVYQLTNSGELRRGHLGERLIKADKGQLASLVRRRRDGQVQLLRHDFTPDETAEYLAQLRQRCRQLSHALQSQQFEIKGQVPENADVIAQIRKWLDSLPSEIKVASSPHAGK